MNALKKLMDQTYSYSVEAGEDMQEMYLADLADFQSVFYALTTGLVEDAKIKINYMDTEPREQAVLAIAEDKGASWVANNLGWKVN